MPETFSPRFRRDLPTSHLIGLSCLARNLWLAINYFSPPPLIAILWLSPLVPSNL